MNFFQAIFLGALQGVAEFLPISSSGHLLVFRNWLGLGDVPLLFDILLHGATLIVVLVVFRRRIGELLAALFRFALRRKKESDGPLLRLILVILGATVVTGLLGVGISQLQIENYPQVASVCFVITGIILIFSRSWQGLHSYGDLGWKHSLFTGFAQGLGVLPGISRSGITISASLFAGLDRERAGEYSFLISIPAIAGAMVLDMKDLGELTSRVEPLMVLAACAAAMIAGFLSLVFLLKLVKKGQLFWFSFYLIPFGIVSFFFL